MEEQTDHASAIISAVQENDLAKVRTLLDTRDMKPQDSEDPSTRHRMHSHQPAFNLALKLGRVEIAEFLLDHGHYVTPGKYSTLEDNIARANPSRSNCSHVQWYPRRVRMELQVVRPAAPDRLEHQRISWAYRRCTDVCYTYPEGQKWKMIVLTYIMNLQISSGCG